LVNRGELGLKERTVRLFATIMNVIVIGLMLVVIACSRNQILVVLLGVFVSVSSILSILAVWFVKSESWIGLYFKRKAAEERKRIAELEGERGAKD